MALYSAPALRFSQANHFQTRHRNAPRLANPMTFGQKPPASWGDTPGPFAEKIQKMVNHIFDQSALSSTSSFNRLA